MAEPGPRGLPVLDRRGPASRPTAPASRTRRGSPSTAGSSTGCSSAASGRSRRCTTGTCRRRSRTQGGWANRDTALRFAEYAAHTVEALGDRVHTWTTFNEPWCSAYLGYGSGAHAPGRTDGADALAAVHHLNLAHGLAVPEIRRAARNEPELSITLNLHVIRAPEDATPDDRVDEAKRRIDALANRAFLGPLLRGRYDDDLLDRHGRRHRLVVPASRRRGADPPADRRARRQLLLDRHGEDVGRRRRRARTPTGTRTSAASPWPGSGDVEFVVQPGPYTEMGWNIAPDGLEELLVSLHEQFPEQTLMITENGAAFPDRVVETDDGKRVPDADRVDYLNRHFTAAHRAIAARSRPAGLLRLVAPGQLRMGLGLHEALRHRAGRLRDAGAHREGQRAAGCRSSSRPAPRRHPGRSSSAAYRGSPHAVTPAAAPCSRARRGSSRGPCAAPTRAAPRASAGPAGSPPPPSA